MQFGASMFSTDYSIRPDDLARLLEDRGFESMWVPEHTHIPADRRSPWPGGADLPRDYWHTYDPFVALTAAAGATTSLKLGTGICLLVERDPITTAKEVASVDRLSNGRFLFGIGGGWNAEEMANHGTRFRRRWRLMRERVLAMKEIWTKDEPEFHGEFVDFDKMWAMAQAGAAAPPACHHGRRRPHYIRPGDRVRRRLDAHRRQGVPRAEPAGEDCAAAASGRGSGPGPGVHIRVHLRHAPGRRVHPHDGSRRSGPAGVRPALRRARRGCASH